MDWLDALLLGILQGLTEFLPVSSSGHLTIAQQLLHLDTSAADNLSFDIVMHAATVLSTLVVLGGEVWRLLRGTFGVLHWNEEKNEVAKLLVSMIPVFVVGMFFKDKVEAIFGSGLTIVGTCLLVTALLLSFSYYSRPRQKETITYLYSFTIGIAQSVAVLPGLSRSGATIATGLLLGNKKEKVAQFSFLMVLIPVLGEAFLSLLKGEFVASSIGVVPIIVGFLAAFISGLFACKFMINVVKRGKLIYFAIYCAIVGAVTLIFSLL
ncbi:MAG: undecaprenyl-diphosphate phosphatase [Bacteroidales bacterium]|nr:undecaprenyl-diphosphate phosphatase [Bacteroidales bacterium]